MIGGLVRAHRWPSTTEGACCPFLCAVAGDGVRLGAASSCSLRSGRERLGLKGLGVDS